MARRPRARPDSAATESAAPTGGPAAPFAVVIADDDAQVRDALAGLIEDHEGLHLVGSADNGDAAAALCSDLHPDVAVVDVMMPSGGATAIVAIKRASPETLVVAYTAMGDRRTRERLLASGATCVFVKGGSIELAETLHQMLRTGS